MMVMCGQSNPVWHYFAGKFPGKVGLLVGPAYHRKVKLRTYMPFACDNDRFGVWSKGQEWSEESWISMLKFIRSSGQKPLWIAVPDTVANRNQTLEDWKRYSPIAAQFGWPLAFVVQDGMRPDDVPDNASVVFVGGTDSWKYQNLPLWSEFPRVHVGRVNAVWRLEILERYGVESCDGSAWFRDTDEGKRIRQLTAWLEGCNKQEMLQI